MHRLPVVPIFPIILPMLCCRASPHFAQDLPTIMCLNDLTHDAHIGFLDLDRGNISEQTRAAEFLNEISNSFSLLFSILLITKNMQNLQSKFLIMKKYPGHDLGVRNGSYGPGCYRWKLDMLLLLHRCARHVRRENPDKARAQRRDENVTSSWLAHAAGGAADSHLFLCDKGKADQLNKIRIARAGKEQNTAQLI